jgi:glycosyltransferase involved in cell wall biosynthesis
LNNDVDVINPDWLTELVSHTLRPDVGAVGAKLYYPDNTLQHGGVILGPGGVAGHELLYAPRSSGGYFNSLNLTRAVSCVTGACLATRRAIFEEVGGFNDRDLKIAYNDVDFCVRVRKAGYKILWTPHAELYHFESASRGSDEVAENLSRFQTEAAYMRQRWGAFLDEDPFYNPNLSLNISHQLPDKSRVRKPWLESAAVKSTLKTTTAAPSGLSSQSFLRDDEFMPPAQYAVPQHAVRCLAFYVLDLAAAKAVTQEWQNFHAKERDLAKRYGISGFCYHFSKAEIAEGWGRLLALAPGLGDDFAFCISVAIDFSPSEAFFVERIAPLLFRPDYLRVGGRPLVLIAFPKGGATVEIRTRQWRQFCRDAGLGEPWLVSTGLDLDPTASGFDAAVDAGSETNDYRELVRANYGHVNAASARIPKVHLGSCGPQAKEMQHVSPAAYQEWLENACRFAASDVHESRGIVLIDSWNGVVDAHRLEPNSRYGHAFLNATAKALQSLDSIAHIDNPKVAVIAHVFYEEIWPEIAAHLLTWQVPFRLYATIPQKSWHIASKIHAQWPDAVVATVPNHGRDIVPFLQQAKLAIADGAEIICKVHTKRSLHRADGTDWRRDVYAKVLGGRDRPLEIAKAFRNNAALGIIAAEGHVICGESYLGANGAKIEHLASRLGYPGSVAPFSFAAGSMFWIRADALQPLLQLDIRADDFEKEHGQVDGTLAHALERVIPIAAKMRGYRLSDTRVLNRRVGNPPDRLRSDDELAHLEQKGPNYRFAPASHVPFSPTTRPAIDPLSGLKYALDRFVARSKYQCVYGYGWIFHKSLAIVDLKLELQLVDGTIETVATDFAQPRRDVHSSFPECEYAKRSGFMVLGTWGQSELLAATLVARLSDLSERRIDVPLVDLDQVPARRFAFPTLQQFRRARGLFRQANGPTLLRQAARLNTQPFTKTVVHRSRFFAELEQISASRSILLVVDHNLGGGANLYREELIANRRRAGEVVMLFSFDLPTLEYGLEIRAEKLQRYTTSPSDILELVERRIVTAIFVNNIVSFPNPEHFARMLAEIAAANPIPVTMAVHDYFWVCPSQHLLDFEGRFCNVPPTENCRACLPNNRYVSRTFAGKTIETWREAWGECLRVSTKIICFSKSSEAILRKAYPDIEPSKLEIRPHAVERTDSTTPRPRPGGPLHIGVVGHISFHKGAEIVRLLAEEIARRRLAIQITIIGSIASVCDPSVVSSTGEYERNQLPQLIERSGANLFLFPSICPETFSYVVQELMQMKVPLVCFDLGAPAERVSGYELGKVIQLSEIGKILDELIAFYSFLDQPQPAEVLA